MTLSAGSRIGPYEIVAAIGAGEWARCIARAMRSSQRVESDAGTFRLRDLTLDICSSNVMPAVSTPRSLDLVHLRTALWFHTAEPLDRFVTLDVSQEEAAKELGLPV